jgi:hypothetical protein
MSTFKRNLKRIWDETGTPVGESPPRGLHRRLIVRSFRDGGTGWGVWDKKHNRFLEDREISALSDEAISETWAN